MSTGRTSSWSAGADHVYRMDPVQMIDQHVARGAGVTVSTVPMPRAAATNFGVAQAAADGHTIEAFTEKPASPPGRAGHPDEALVSSAGAIVSGGLIRGSVLSPGVRVAGRSRVNRAVILDNSHVHRGAVVENAILDKDVAVLAGATVGVDKEHDRARGFTVSAGGVTVVSKGQVVAP
jgi:ADP-glucose pyrophosphorylase